jgi:hypothetical protein
LDDDLIEIWEEPMPDIGKILRTSVLIGGLNESQYVLLIPQKNKCDTLEAAEVYAHVSNIDKAEICIAQYQKEAKDIRPY